MISKKRASRQTKPKKVPDLDIKAIAIEPYYYKSNLIISRELKELFYPIVK